MSDDIKSSVLEDIITMIRADVGAHPDATFFTYLRGVTVDNIKSIFYLNAVYELYTKLQKNDSITKYDPIRYHEFYMSEVRRFVELVYRDMRGKGIRVFRDEYELTDLPIVKRGSN